MLLETDFLSDRKVVICKECPIWSFSIEMVPACSTFRLVSKVCFPHPEHFLNLSFYLCLPVTCEKKSKH